MLEHRRQQRQATNRDAEQRPHGVFPCAGKDRWIAIAVASEAQWQALCGVMERPDLLDQRDSGEAVDAAIAAWTSARDGAESEASLQASGVPAHRVLDTVDLYACPQLQHRGHYIDIACDLYQSSTVSASGQRVAAKRRFKSSISASLAAMLKGVISLLMAVSSLEPG